MKRLILCNDGTWNTPDQEDNGIPSPTNVVKLYHALAERDTKGVRQLKYYHPGVGAAGGIVDSVLGGAMGVGIGNHIRSAYHWIATHYAPGDEIFIYGFSRGAFTARSLGGLIGRGLLKLDDVDSKESWTRVEAAYTAYRERKSDWARPGWTFFDQGRTPIRFIGVWDTVGALGVPDDLEVLNLFDNKDKWRFHDTALGAHVQTARHAMAIDEVRASFTVTRWSNAAEHPDAVELWFPGVHSDVGGGYATTDLSDGALIWMLDQSKQAGLCFRPGIRTTLKPDPHGVMHNSYKGAFAKLRSRPRAVDTLTPANKAKFHASALKRQKLSPIAYPAYRPTHSLKKIGDTWEVDVFADIRWNDTGLYLEAGHEYTFAATGEWVDSKDVCDWRGTENDEFTKADIVRGVSSFLGKFESLVVRLTKNNSTDFLGTKRVEKFRWFTLVGAIANDRGDNAVVPNDGSPSPHEYVDLPAHTVKPFAVTSPGYLYCFPNDVWSLYGNNHGSVKLTITRVG
ncbi:MAG: DUF2235 domain-containing protein [Opitutaceae bacterium]|nr:DUF2235 domain-containing protein [Opitutaceae bacterium]